LEGSEPAASRIEDVLQGEQPVMSWINVGRGLSPDIPTKVERDAHDVMSALRSALTLELPDEHRILQAATVKGLHSVADADAFAVATAVRRDAVLRLRILRSSPEGAIGRLNCVRAARHGNH
jgi:hypothetical protein